MNRIVKYVVALVLGLVLFSAAFIGGIVFAQFIDIADLNAFGRPESDLGEQVEEVERLIDREGLSPASETSKTIGAISGLLDSLDDPYAMYFDPEQFEYFNEQSNGTFCGIGVTIAERDGVVYVVSIIEDTPADEAGLQPDDEFVSIDDVSRERWDINEVVKRVRGPEGTAVTLEIRRPDPDDSDSDGELFTVDIVRAKVDIPNTMTRMIGDDVGYIRLLTFSTQAADDLRDAISELESQGARGFVLDVRDNPGGLLSSSVEVASLFIDDGVIVRVEERDTPQVEHRTSGEMVTSSPLVVLINGNSASASEVLAGALQDYGRAQLVGEQSFGKGSVQAVERLSFGGGLKFTIAHYLTPEGRAIDGEGLTPDIEIAMDPEEQAAEEDDIQIDRAVEALREKL